MPRPPDPHARDALVAAARAEFAKKGLRGARIEDITAACGLSKGAFYLHFDSKEALFQTLVDAFMEEMTVCADCRIEGATRLFKEHGRITPEDFRRGTPRLVRFIDYECAEDLRVLEALWKYRDVCDVLISGCQGTKFEGLLWEVLDAEQVRVADVHRQFQEAGVCRDDVPAELFGALVIGTYLLVAKTMARAKDKPDLEMWARTLQRLIREGSLPRDQKRPAASTVRKRSAR